MQLRRQGRPARPGLTLHHPSGAAIASGFRAAVDSTTRDHKNRAVHRHFVLTARNCRPLAGSPLPRRIRRRILLLRIIGLPARRIHSQISRPCLQLAYHEIEQYRTAGID